MKKKPMKEKFIASLKIIGMLWLASTVISMFFISEDVSTGNVALIPIQGIISVGDSSSFSSGYVTSDSVIESLKKAEKNDNIKAIILDINSPGGSGVAADEISQMIKSIDKPVISVVRELGASAAYWIASSSDTIFANRLSFTGSIGVIGSYLDFSGFIEEYNITYQRFVSGKFKDFGSPFKEPSKEEKEIFQNLIDEVADVFIEEVALNRNIPVDDVRKIATGQIFLGKKSNELGLIDIVGTKEDALKYIENELNITVEIKEFKKKKSITDILSELSTTLRPKLEVSKISGFETVRI